MESFQLYATRRYTQLVIVVIRLLHLHLSWILDEGWLWKRSIMVGRHMASYLLVLCPTADLGGNQEAKEGWERNKQR